ncbi:hypothetical protein G4B88_022249 [Cannabis sativa]|uniref:Uncharacterized protein n=1 Tax=Cannabis sativa TaxID=3483 RepID=A0A7J6DKU7_CANSA|nr:hypothetical protein G4B88_022249 [Cannabis sativa]
MLEDLNGTLSDNECYNYNGNMARYAFDLRRMVHRSGLIDLGFQGPVYTWAKGGTSSNGVSKMKRVRIVEGGSSSMITCGQETLAVFGFLKRRGREAECFLRKYQEIFKKSIPTLTPLKEGTMQKLISEYDNAELNAIPTAEEIQKAIWDMGRDKAPDQLEERRILSSWWSGFSSEFKAGK